MGKQLFFCSFGDKFRATSFLLPWVLGSGNVGEKKKSRCFSSTLSIKPASFPVHWRTGGFLQRELKRVATLTIEARLYCCRIACSRRLVEGKRIKEVHRQIRRRHTGTWNHHYKRYPNQTQNNAFFLNNTKVSVNIGVNGHLV